MHALWVFVMNIWINIYVVSATENETKHIKRYVLQQQQKNLLYCDYIGENGKSAYINGAWDNRFTKVAICRCYFFFFLNFKILFLHAKTLASLENCQNEKLWLESNGSTNETFQEFGNCTWMCSALNVLTSSRWPYMLP